MSNNLAKRVRSNIEAAKKNLDLARERCKTSATLQARRLCEAVKVARAWCDAIDCGISLPGEEVICMMPARPLSDEAALGLWKMFIAPAIRGANKSQLAGRSGFLDFAEDESLESEDRIASDWSDLFYLLAEAVPEELSPIVRNNPEKDENKLPEEPDTLALIKYLKKHRSEFGSNIACIRDFCEKNDIKRNPENWRVEAKRFEWYWKP